MVKLLGLFRKIVSINSDGTIIAGAYNDGNGANSGHVRVYLWNGAAWVQRGSDIDGEAAGDASGISVSISNNGEILTIGASANDGNGNSSGQLRVYEWSGVAWVKKGIDIDGNAAGDLFGENVSVNADGTFVAVGAPGANSNGNDAYTKYTRLERWGLICWFKSDLYSNIHN